MCDAIFFFKAAVEAGGPDVSTDSWLAGVSRINGLASASTFTMNTTNRHDGVGTIRTMAYFDDCNCWHYTSPEKPV